MVYRMTNRQTYKPKKATMRSEQWKAIYNLVKAQPGINKPLLARTLGLYAYGIDSILCGMDNAGMLLAEDDLGRLYVMEDEW
jgi:hypothetical protein